MKEQVTDISKLLQDMAEGMRLMRETIDRQYAEILKLSRNTEALNRQIRNKNEEIAKLKARLAKYEEPDKNSGNSGTPPSKEKMKDEIARRTKTLRKPSGKKSGGQKGHDGHKLYSSSTPDDYTLLFRADGRSSKVLADKFGDSLERMTAVTDRHSAYFALNFLNHQVCLAHLLRELQYLSELDTKQDWSEKVATLLREAIHERNSKPDAVIDKSTWLNRLDDLLKENIEKLGKKFNTFRKGMIKCRNTSSISWKTRQYHLTIMQAKEEYASSKSR